MKKMVLLVLILLISLTACDNPSAFYYQPFIEGEWYSNEPLIYFQNVEYELSKPYAIKEVSVTFEKLKEEDYDKEYVPKYYYNETVPYVVNLIRNRYNQEIFKLTVKLKINDDEELISYDCATMFKSKGIVSQGPEGYGFLLFFKDDTNNIDLVVEGSMCVSAFNENNVGFMYEGKYIHFVVVDDHFVEYDFKLKQKKVEVEENVEK